MTALLAVLTPIALLNSLWFLPRGIAGIATALGTPRPVLTASALVAGKFVPNLAFGLVVAVGLDLCFDQIEARAQSLWQGRDSVLVGLQLVLGVLMIGFAYRLSRSSQALDAASSTRLTPVGAFSVSAAMTIAGLPSAVLYFAAIDQVLRADLGIPAVLKSLLFFNLVCMLPLMLIVSSRALLGARIDPWFRALASSIARWGRQVVLVGLLGLGAALAWDAIGWFAGRPLLPAYVP